MTLVGWLVGGEEREVAVGEAADRCKLFWRKFGLAFWCSGIEVDRDGRLMGWDGRLVGWEVGE